MSSLLTNKFSEFSFNFRRVNLDGLFTESDRLKMLKWIDQSCQLLVDILRHEQYAILNIWFNIYDNVYERMDSSMGTSKCLDILQAPPTNNSNLDPCLILNELISSFEISIPHPTSLISPSTVDLHFDGLGKRILDFDNEYAASKIFYQTPTILLNHRIFDVNRQIYDKADIINEYDGILFLAVVLAHEITHTINLTRSITMCDGVERGIPNLKVFKSYSHGGVIDAGYLIERILLDGEMNLSHSPPSPPRLFLSISSTGTQVTLDKNCSEECIKKKSFRQILQLVDSADTDRLSQAQSLNQSPKLKPLLHYRMEEHHSIQTSPIMPILKPMLSFK